MHSLMSCSLIIKTLPKEIFIKLVFNTPYIICGKNQRQVFEKISPVQKIRILRLLNVKTVQIIKCSNVYVLCHNYVVLQ